jgi:hypothetical protein
MKKSGLVAVGVAVLTVLLVCGCKSTPKGPTDEELIANLITEWQAGVTAKDIDRMMAVYSESFAGSRGEDKAGVRAFMEQAMAAGYLDGVQIDTTGATTTIEEGKATVGPVKLTGAMGAVNITMNLVKEEAGWLIVGSQMQQ